MGIMPRVAGEPWAIGLAVALASSYAHFLIVGSPTNALTFALEVYPDTNKRVTEAIDFVKYGFGFHVLSMLLLWIIGFLVIIQLLVFRMEFLSRQHGFFRAQLLNRRHLVNGKDLIFFLKPV
jgi:sodium-dependent dicarboxylate transporter 2/3/5